MRHRKIRGVWGAIGLLLTAAAATGQVPPNFEIVQMANDLGFHSRPELNDRSELTWSSNFPPDVAEVFLFTNGVVRRNTSSNWCDIHPVINNTGMLAWMRALDCAVPYDVMLLKDGEVNNISGTFPTVESPHLNETGQVVWTHDIPNEALHMELYFFDGKAIQQITDNGVSNQEPRINNSGQTVWTRVNFFVSPRVHTIMLYDDGEIFELTDDQFTRPWSPDINEAGQVVWGSSREGIWVWEDGEMTLVTDDGVAPRLNNHGDIAFQRWNGEEGRLDILFYSEGVVTQLPIPAEHEPFRPRINDRLEMTWTATVDEVGNTGQFFMRRIAPKGDSNHDCHIDFADFQAFQICFTGADNGPPGGLLGDCTRSDFDDDNDVDGDDYQALLSAFTGSGQMVPDCEL